MPAEPLDRLRRELAGLVEPASCGIWLTKSAMLFVGDVFWMSCCVSTVSGVGAWKPSRRMRVPVTRIWPSSAAAAWAAACGVCGSLACAQAGSAIAMAAKAVLLARAFLNAVASIIS